MFRGYDTVFFTDKSKIILGVEVEVLLNMQSVPVLYGLLGHITMFQAEQLVILEDYR